MGAFPEALNWAVTGWLGMSVTIRVSEATYNRLLQIQRELKDQKDEKHQLMDITQKLVLNAPVETLYGIKLESVHMEEPLERIG